MEVLRIYLEEQSHIKHFMIKFLILQKIQNITYTNMNLLQWFENLLIKGGHCWQTNLPLVETKKQELILKTKQKKKKKNEELRSINKKFKKQKVSLLFIDKSWGADLVDIQLLSKLIRETLFYCVIDFFFYALYVILKDKNSFQLLHFSEKFG